MHGAKWASSLVVNNINNNADSNNNSSSTSGLISLGQSFQQASQVRTHDYAEGLRGSAPCDLHSPQFNDALITPVLALLALSSQPSWGQFHWRGSKPLNSSSTRESKDNDLDIHRLSSHHPGSWGLSTNTRQKPSSTLELIIISEFSLHIFIQRSLEQQTDHGILEKF